MDIRLPPCDAAQLSRGTRIHPRLGRLHGRGRPPVLQPGRPPRPRLAALPRGTSPGPMPRLTARTAAAPRTACRSFLDAYLDWLADPAEQRRRRVSIQMWADALVNDRLRPSVRAGIDQQAIARDFITAAQAAGDLPADVPADGLTRVLLAIIQGFIFQQAWEPDIDIGSYRQAVGFLIDALTAT